VAALVSRRSVPARRGDTVAGILETNGDHLRIEN
jgi:hypothetical protein